MVILVRFEAEGGIAEQAITIDPQVYNISLDSAPESIGIAW